MNEQQIDQITKDVLRVAKRMDSFEVTLLGLALAGMNEALNNWHTLSGEEQGAIRESFGTIMDMAEQAKHL